MSKLQKNQITLLEDYQKSKEKCDKSTLLDLAEKSVKEFPNTPLHSIIMSEFYLIEDVKHGIKEMENLFNLVNVKDDFLDQVLLLLFGKLYFRNNNIDESLKTIKK
jgi:hypothetical protein